MEHSNGSGFAHLSAARAKNRVLSASPTRRSRGALHQRPDNGQTMHIYYKGLYISLLHFPLLLGLLLKHPTLLSQDLFIFSGTYQVPVWLCFCTWSSFFLQRYFLFPWKTLTNSLIQFKFTACLGLALTSLGRLVAQTLNIYCSLFLSHSTIASIPKYLFFCLLTPVDSGLLESRVGLSISSVFSVEQMPVM